VTLDLTLLEDPKSMKKRGNPQPSVGLSSAPDQPQMGASIGEQEDKDLESKVQILDLHTDNPLVSYCGQMFSCHWAENIGTEFFFTKNDRKDIKERFQLMPGGVNLLGTSSVRLMSTPVKAEPRSEATGGRQGVSSRTKAGNAIKPKDLAIDVGPRPSQRRIQQAKFLEDLQRVKEMRGEQDLVTIHSEKRYTNAKWKKEMIRQRALQISQLQSALEGDNEEAREEARKGLEKLDEEERHWPLGGEENRNVSGQPARKRQKVIQLDEGMRKSPVATVRDQNSVSTPSSRTPTPYLQLRSRSTTPSAPFMASRSLAPPPTVQQSITTQSNIPDALQGLATEGDEADTPNKDDPSTGVTNISSEDTAILPYSTSQS
jgi:hypothetical protein